MKYLALILILSGCSSGAYYGGESFFFIEGENKVLHCWVEKEDNRTNRYCQKEEGF